MDIDIVIWIVVVVRCIHVVNEMFNLLELGLSLAFAAGVLPVCKITVKQVLVEVQL
jgi:hypothetical protein